MTIITVIKNFQKHISLAIEKLIPLIKSLQSKLCCIDLILGISEPKTITKINLLVGKTYGLCVKRDEQFYTININTYECKSCNFKFVFAFNHIMKTSLGRTYEKLISI